MPSLAAAFFVSLLVTVCARWFVRRGMAPLCTLSQLPLRLVVTGAVCTFAGTCASAALVVEGLVSARSQTATMAAFCVFALCATSLFSVAIEGFTRAEVFREAAGFDADRLNAR